jgi:hypothetical protein
MMPQPYGNDELELADRVVSLIGRWTVAEISGGLRGNYWSTSTGLPRNLLPDHQYRAPGESTSHSLQKNALTGFNTPVAHGDIQRERN